ncbi:MAG: hypothetical protein JWP01_3649 [Myxococcales bacterium]|nr:hypothetical protein [Myxococcales bacterium]
MVLVGFALVLMTALASAAPRTVLVLPVDGNADPSVRAKLNLSVQKLARKLPGKVSVGDTTFTETAAAVGCDPTAPDCAEMVRSTLGVDELVHGTATWKDGETRLVVRRTVAKEPTRSVLVVLAAEEAPEKSETTLGPLFDGSGGTTEPVATDPDPLAQQPPPSETPPPPAGPSYDNRKRNKGIIFAAAGGVTLVIGLALWSNKSSVQDDIDDLPARDPEDFERLEQLESRAFKYAMVGNVMVVAALALGGYGGWTLYQDRKERRIAVVPQVTPTTAGLVVGGHW